jgi:hypothetical protein
MMTGRSHMLFSRKPWFQRRPYTNFLCARANLGLSLVSLLGLTAFVGCSWPRLNLDSAAQDSHSPRETSRENQKRRTYYESYTRNDGFNIHVRHPHAHTQTFEQTGFPGNHTGVARYDTAKTDSPGCVSHTRTLSPDNRADGEGANKETTQRTSQLASSQYLRASGPSSPYSAPTIPTHPIPAHYPGYDETSSQPSSARSQTHTTQTNPHPAHTSTTLCGTHLYA